MNELIIYILKVVAIHGLFYLVYRLAFRNSGHHVFNRGYVLIAVISAFFIPFIELSIPEKTQTAEEISVIMWLSEPVAGIEEFELVPVEEQKRHSYWVLAPWLYGLIAIVLLIRSVFYLILLARLKYQSEYINKRWFKLFKISQDRPFSFFSNVFMPKSLFGTDSFDQILTHECEHVRQFHSLDRLLMDFVVSLFWFNPFIYLYRNALIEIHEYQADEVVVNRFKDPVAYQEILYSQLQSAEYSGLVSHFNFSMIKKRIVMMNKKSKMSGWVYALAAPVTLMVIFAFSSKEAMEPLNDVGDEIAAMLGPEEGFDWPEITLQEKSNESKGQIQDNIPSISPIKSSDLVRLSSSFGMRTHPIKKTKQLHKGVDFACPLGTEVMATADGTVTGIDNKPEGYGKLVTITHSNGYKSRYAQLSEFKVKKGDEVKKGDVIALSGNSGMSTAPHLHYEVTLMDKHVNPIDFIKDYNFKAKQEYKKEEQLKREEELAQQQLQLAEQEKELAERQQLLAMQEQELAAREMELAKEAEERRQMELRIQNEKLKFDDSKQEPSMTVRSLLNDDGIKPLFVIDGKLVEDVSNLEPDDIESITVLKGKSAKAIYGSKSKNGVVEIKTKKKNKNKSKSKDKSKEKDKSKDKSKGTFRVMIDPGHGGMDAGTQSKTGLLEKELALEVSHIIGAYFSNRDDIEILYTRDDDESITLEDRAEASKEVDLFISIHANSDADKDKRFTSVLVDAQSEYFQESLEVSQLLGGKFREIDRETKIGVADIYLMRTSYCPSVLVEIGYLSNETDLSYLTSPKGKEEIAASIASAIESSANSF